MLWKRKLYRIAENSRSKHMVRTEVVELEGNWLRQRSNKTAMKRKTSPKAL